MIPFRFCPFCTGELQTRRIPEDGPERRVCSACGFIQWGNSKPTAAGIVRDTQGRVLLGRRNVAPFRGMWDLPGGFLEPGEHPEEGARRELREETGLTVTDLRLVGVYMGTYGEEGAGPAEDLLNFYYECRTVGEVVAADDISEAAWFAPEELPWELIAFEANRQALTHWLQSLGLEVKDSG